jgi:hypothetical protein
MLNALLLTYRHFIIEILLIYPSILQRKTHFFFLVSLFFDSSLFLALSSIRFALINALEARTKKLICIQTGRMISNY